MKRFTLVTACLFLLLAGMAFAVPEVAGTGATATPDHIVLTWTGDPATTQTITWRTDTSVAQAMLSLTEGKRTSVALVTARAIETDLGPVHLFSHTFTGLKPHTTYVYQIGDGKIRGEAHSFTTADPHARAFNFLVFGDSQSGIRDKMIYAPWEKTIHNAYAVHPDARFCINMGDLVEVGEMYAHWNGWFAAARGVIDTIPQMPVEGNHETYVPDTTASAIPKSWVTQFPMPQNGPAGLTGQVYSYDYGNVHFAVLDSQQDEEQPVRGDILQAQTAWLDADLAASKAPWKIVLFHKTPYDLKANRPNPAIKAAFCPVIERHHVDLVLNGHDHGIAYTYPIAHDVIKAKPSEGTIYYITGRSGNKTYSDLAKKPVDAFFFNPLDQPCYLVVEVADRQLTVHAVKQDGTPIDNMCIDKVHDTLTDLPAAGVLTK